LTGAHALQFRLNETLRASGNSTWASRTDGSDAPTGRRGRPRIVTQEISMKQSAMKRTFALMLLALFSMNMLAACNTVAGAGKDVQKAGEKVEDKAEDCKDSHC
jgi:predicted small secreted protein